MFYHLACMICVSQIMSETDRKVLEDILFAVDDENTIPDMKELVHEPIHRVEGFRFSPVPPPQLFFKHDDELILHPELRIIKENRNLRQKLIDP